MKKNKVLVMSGIMAMCALGFGLNVSASSLDTQSVFMSEDTTSQDVTSYTSDATVSEETSTETASVNPCPNGYADCDGIHTNENCPYGNEPKHGMGNHQGNGNGLRDGSHTRQQLKDGSGRTNAHGYCAGITE